MYILSPEKNINYLKYYHKSSKIMLPLIGVSALLEYYNTKNPINKNNNIKNILISDKFLHLNNFFHMANVLNFGYHSYLSTSCVITDYIKNVKFEKVARVVSAKSHALGILGLGYYLFNKSEKNAKKINEYISNL